MDCCAIKKQHVHKISVAKMRMLRWISGNIGLEMVNSLTYRGDPYWWKDKGESLEMVW